MGGGRDPEPRTPPLRFTILEDPKENPRKCTARPLAGLPGIELIRLPRRPAREPFEVPGGIWLVLDAPPLAPADRGRLGPEDRVVLFDAVWARIPALRRRVRVRPGATAVERSLPEGIVTAYPRRSKLYEDPACGLATVEAVYAAAWILGEVRADILATYRWAGEFLARNRGFFGGARSRDRPGPRV